MAAGRARNAITIKARTHERDVLWRLTRRRKLARADVRRAEIILRAAEGLKQLLDRRCGWRGRADRSHMARAVRRAMSRDAGPALDRQRLHRRHRYENA
jgi:hypothetical protein